MSDTEDTSRVKDFLESVTMTRRYPDPVPSRRRLKASIGQNNSQILRLINDWDSCTEGFPIVQLTHSGLVFSDPATCPLLSNVPSDTNDELTLVRIGLRAQGGKNLEYIGNVLPHGGHVMLRGQHPLEV